MLSRKKYIFPPPSVSPPSSFLFRPHFYSTRPTDGPAVNGTRSLPHIALLMRGQHTHILLMISRGQTDRHTHTLPPPPLAGCRRAAAAAGAFTRRGIGRGRQPKGNYLRRRGETRRAERFNDVFRMYLKQFPQHAGPDFFILAKKSHITFLSFAHWRISPQSRKKNEGGGGVEGGGGGLLCYKQSSEQYSLLPPSSFSPPLPPSVSSLLSIPSPSSFPSFAGNERAKKKTKAEEEERTQTISSGRRGQMNRLPLPKQVRVPPPRLLPPLA